MKVSIKKKEKMLSSKSCDLYPYSKKRCGEILTDLTGLISDLAGIVCSYMPVSEALHNILLSIENPKTDFEFAKFILDTFPAQIYFQGKFLYNVQDLFKIFFRKNSLEDFFRINSLEIIRISTSDSYFQERVQLIQEDNKYIYLNYTDFEKFLRDSGFSKSIAELITDAVIYPNYPIFPNKVIKWMQ